MLPVRSACDLSCRFCFSASSISALDRERVGWDQLDVGAYYRFALEHGATRLVITGGGEPLLRPDDVLRLIRIGREYFPEITCFTNGTGLTPALSRALSDAGLTYLCWSRHHWSDARSGELMGGGPTLARFFAAAEPLTVRATCVMARGFVDDRAGCQAYMDALGAYGVRQFTFKHTYVTYPGSVFQGSAEDRWAAAHQVQEDPFEGEGTVLDRLPWGPRIRRIEEHQVCFYREPTPAWERTNRLCRSVNLLADGRMYASLEDRQSLLSRLQPSPQPPQPSV